MKLCIPICEGQEELTQQCVKSIKETAPDVQVVLYGNGCESSLSVPIMLGEKNIGYYAPLKHAYKNAVEDGDPYVGLCHNDIIFYEKGWDARMREAFEADLKLGLIGLCGSNEADQAGGRGGGTMCFFRGDKGQSQAAGRRITDLQPAVFLDSLFMMFRTPVISALQENWDNLTLAHFYDKIWPLKLYEMGWRTAVLGSEIDHIGSQTIGTGEDGAIPAEEAYREGCKLWFEERGEHIADICHKEDGIDYELAMYLIAERRLLNTYRDNSKRKLIPCKIDDGYQIHPLQG